MKKKSSTSMKKKSSTSIAMLYKAAFVSLLIFAQIDLARAKEAENKQNKILPQITVLGSTENVGEVKGYKTGISSSSTRTETKLINTPQSVSVITNEQIQDQRITNMEEASRYVPGVVIQQGEANRDQITIRGNSTTSDFYIDGARDDVQYFRDFYNIDRIEFLKGPNAMAFGRGGAGGVVNRVSKFADDELRRKIIISGGSFDNRRIEADLGGKTSENSAFRLNSMYEKSGTFRQHGDLERYGISPTATLKFGKNTDLKLGYEHFVDNRFNDRGIPSQNGSPFKTSSSTFFGNPNENESNAKVNSAFAVLNHKFDESLNLKNYTRYSQNDKFYQNVYASSAIKSSGNLDIAAYNDRYQRNNFTNQFDLTKKFQIGEVKHLALFGSELTKQFSKNKRNTGYFNNSSSTTSISALNPISLTPITFRPGTNDNDNKAQVNVYAAYLQDQIEFNKFWQLTAGIRFDRFEMDLLNNRTSVNYGRSDNLYSPRLGLVFKPKEEVSIYSSYSVSYLPSSGEQFNNLNSALSMLKPEKMENYEIGSKWDVNPNLNLTSAIFQLNRTNSRAVDPNNPGFYVPTGESQTKGIELSANGKITNKLQIIASFTHQEAKIVNPISTSTTSNSSAADGKKLALTPRNRTALWGKYDFTKEFAVGLGAINQSSQFASVDNSVRLKGFTRLDGAVYYKISPSYRLQANIENLLGADYIQTAHNNNNIQPGSPRAYKISLLADF